MISEEQLQGVFAWWQRDSGLGLAEAKMLVLVVGRNCGHTVNQFLIDQQVMVAGVLLVDAAGATPIPAKPNFTVTGPEISAPSFGSIKYTFAVAGAV